MIAVAAAVALALGVWLRRRHKGQTRIDEVPTSEDIFYEKIALDPSSQAVNEITSTSTLSPPPPPPPPPPIHDDIQEESTATTAPHVDLQENSSYDPTIHIES